MKSLYIIIFVCIGFLIQESYSSTSCSYYPFGAMSNRLTTTCAEICCSTTFPRTISEACCKKQTSDLSWIWILVIVLLSCFPCVIVIVGLVLLLVLAILFSPCLIVLIIVKCVSSKNKKSKDDRNSIIPSNPTTNTTTIIHLETDHKPPAYDQLNFNTLNQTAHPVNNTNFSSNMGFNSSDQIMPVLPSPLKAY